jgi:hypothetical protein
MESLIGIISEELMFPARLADVLEFIKRAPIKGQRKVELLMGWARTVGVKISASQYNAVRFSGTDYPPAPTKPEVP